MKKFFNGKSDVNGTNAARSGDAQAGQNDRSGRVMFAGRGASARFVRANASGVARGDGVAKTPLNKRLMALVLAIVMVLALVPAGVFVLRPKAEASLQMDPVNMQIKINGQITGNADINPGRIVDNIGDVSIENPTNAEFVKAVVIDSNGYETQIYAIGDRNHDIYYSVNDNSYTGSKAEETDTFMLIYANKKQIRFSNATESNGVFTTSGGEGTFRTNARSGDNAGEYYLYGGEDLEINEVTPAQDYRGSSVSYQNAYLSSSVKIKNNTAIVSKDAIEDNTNITVSFSSVTSYSVQDARDMSSSTYYPNLSGADNHGGTSTNTSSDTGSLNSATEDGGWATSFYVFSQANSTNSEVWRLSMLSINGVDIKYPVTEGSFETATVNGMGVTVTFTDADGYFNGQSNKPRTFYRIDLTNVHQNVEVAYYFVNTKAYNLVIKGLTGIAQTGAAIEDEYLLKRYYTFDTNVYNVYTANYTAPGWVTGTDWYPSDNLALYRVKPGYNPYTVTTEMSYDNGATKTSSGIREQSSSGGDAEANTPLEVIKNAGNSSTGRYNTAFRYWGKNPGKNSGGLENDDNTYRKGTKTYNLLLTTLYQDETTNGNTWYAVALAQKDEHVQQLYLNAIAYKYKIELNLNDSQANLSDERYDVGTPYYLEKDDTHTIDTNNYTYLPSSTPVRQGKYFMGWQMVDENNDLISETIYKPSARIDINETTIQNAIGDPHGTTYTIRFKAKWGDLKDAVTTRIKINTYVQNAFGNTDETKYNHVVTDAEETQVVGETALLYDGSGVTYSPYYYMNTEKSDPYKETDTIGENGQIPPSNEFSVYYDYKLQTLSVEKTVIGYPKAKSYEITVTLKRDKVDNVDSPITFETAQDLIALVMDGSNDAVPVVTSVDNANEAITYVLTLSKDDKVIFSNIPYGWTYTVTEPEEENNYRNSISNESGQLTKDIDVVVTNMVDTTELFTNKYISGPDANGKYELTLETWANSEKVTKYDKEAVDTDIVLVVDQSGSMATGDMGSTYTAVNKSWKIPEAAGDKVYYFYDTNDQKYYPVHAGTGTVYVEAESARIYDMMKEGRGDSSGDGQGTWVTPFGNTAYYNIPSDYYYPDSNGVMHRVYIASVGVLGRYKAFTYYYKDYSHEVVSGDNGDGTEWNHWITWIGTFHADNLESLTALNGRAWRNELNYIEWVGMPSNMNKSSWEGFTYSWFSDGDMVSGLYRLSTGLNSLYYTRDNGTVVNLTDLQNRTVYRTENDVAYNGTLYEITGKTRYAALQDSVKDFAQLVAENAEENGTTNRLAIVGFAGNETPALSSGTTPNSSGLNDKWDYVNTGLFTSSGTFLNYNQINSYRKLSSSETAYTNRHYYILDSGSYVPVLCDTNNRWYRLDTYYYVSGTDGTKYYDFYEPVYAPLNNNDGNQYKNAYVDISVNDGNDDNDYNDTVDTIISKFSAYGGTYTSYGMAMANQILNENWDDEKNHIIVVFTDGQPGGYGFEEAIANEATAEAALAKQKGVSIYTIGLYTENQTQQVTDFMNVLSSNASHSTTSNVFGGSQNKVSADGTTNLDANETYYYTDKTDGKTYSVSAKDNEGNETLGWWSTTQITSNGETFNTYSSYVPRINSSDDRSDHTNFYTTATGNTQVYSGDGSCNSGSTYWVGTSGSRKEVKYEYRWYNSNGRVKDPKTSESDDSLNHVQFFTVTNPSDYVNNGFYQTAANELALKNKFKDIAENMSKTTTALSGDKSLVRDVVTGNFKNVSDGDVTIYTVEGTYDATDADNPYKWVQEGGSDKLIPVTDNSIYATVTPDDEKSIVDVKGFDFSREYLSASKTSGKKLVVKIANLDPNKVGFDRTSNTSESAVYELKENDEKTLLAPFDIPSINRPEYKLIVDGDDTNARYTVKLRFTKTDDNDQEVALTADQVRKLNGNLGTLTNFDNDGWATWETASASVEGDTIILENIFKDIPEGYHVYAKVVRSGDNSDAFNYSATVTQEESTTNVGFDNSFELTESGATIEISSTRKPVPITIKEITQKLETAANDFSDPEKLFDVVLTLTTDAEGTNPVEGNYSGITFDSDGQATIQMKHGDIRNIDLPTGYYLAIDVDEATQDSYIDTYKVKVGDGAETDKGDTYFNQIVANQMITVINSMDEIPITGFSDNERSFGVVLGCIAAVSAAAAAGYVVMRRRRART